MLRKFGCGCVYLMQDANGKYGRCIDYCGSSGDDSYSLGIGNEINIEQHIRLEYRPGIPLTPQQEDEMFERLRTLIFKGYKFEELKKILEIK